MKSIVGLSVFLGVLSLTLAPKLTVGQQRSLDRPDVAAVLHDFFEHHGYLVHSRPGEPLEANLRQCRILAMEANPAGGSGDALRIPIAGLTSDHGEDSIFFVFNGQVYPDQPTVRTVFQYLLTRVQLRLNIPAVWKPVLALRASPHCSIPELPWNEIARLPSDG